MIKLSPFVLIIGFVMASCDDSEICEWPERPDCQPVGTTLVVEERLGEGCVQLHYFDELGEAAVGEMICT